MPSCTKSRLHEMEMAEILLLPRQIHPEGAERLLSALSEEFASGKDLGPRGPQMRAIGLALEHLCLELRRSIRDLPIDASGEARSDLERWRDAMTGLADAYARLGACVRHFPL